MVILALLSTMMPLALAVPRRPYIGVDGPIWMSTERGLRPTFLPSGWDYEDLDYSANIDYPIDATLLVYADDITYRLQASQLELTMLGHYPDNYDYYGRYTRYVYRHELSDACKIALIARQCQGLCSLSGEISKAESAAPVTMATLREYIDSEQIAPIWQHLTMRDAEYITSRQLNAEQALRYIQTTEQYRTTPDLQKYTDYCLNGLVDCSELRHLMMELDSRNASFYQKCSAQSLIQSAKSIESSRTMQDLKSTVNYLGGNNTGTYWLKQRFTTRQLRDYCDDLSSLARVYYPGYVDALDQAVFTTTY